MKLLDRLFRRSGRRADQQDELDYRMALSEVRRQAAAMHREVERCRSEAYRLEMSGDHAAAVSKAAEAANSEKAYEAAQSTLRRCESMRAQARSQKMLTDLLTVCEQMSTSVMRQIDTGDALRVQALLQQTTVAMEEAQEGMTAFQEGFEPNAEPALRIAAGEEALAGIMAERAARAEPPSPPTGEQIAAADADSASRTEWLREKRRELADIV